ncbi:MAG: peptidylprolyl isomerase [Clostridia bacterium]|nr:peptidylprolyl isomerase [Clostridia bacterium]
MTKLRIELRNGKHMDLILDEKSAPLTVDNFLKYVDDGFYNGLIFHRVIPGFMIQGGGFKDDEPGIKEKPATYPPIKGEFTSNGIANPIKHVPGVISMARTYVKDSATSQFFICVAPCEYLDGEYAAFGKLADKESLDVAIGISDEYTHSWRGYDDIPDNAVVIKTIKRIED